MVDIVVKSPVNTGEFGRPKQKLYISPLELNCQIASVLYGTMEVFQDVPRGAKRACGLSITYRTAF